MNKNLVRDFSIMLVILISPFLFYIYLLFPEDKVYETIFFKIDSGIHEDVQYFIWLIAVKVLTIIILSLWYITSRSTIIKHVITLCISFEFLKINNILRFDFDFNNLVIEYSYILIFVLPFVILLNRISKSLGYSRQNFEINFNREINYQLTKLSKFNVKDYKTIKRNITLLRKQKKSISKEEYLKKLILLRDKLTID